MSQVREGVDQRLLDAAHELAHAQVRRRRSISG
jgi:hypothetical protein